MSHLEPNKKPQTPPALKPHPALKLLVSPEAARLRRLKGGVRAATASWLLGRAVGRPWLQGSESGCSRNLASTYRSRGAYPFGGVPFNRILIFGGVFRVPPHLGNARMGLGVSGLGLLGFPPIYEVSATKLVRRAFIPPGKCPCRRFPQSGIWWSPNRCSDLRSEARRSGSVPPFVGYPKCKANLKNFQFGFEWHPLLPGLA